MTANGVIQILLFFGIVLALTKPLGAYMARVFDGERTFLDPVLGPVERVIYRLSGVEPEVEQHWTTTRSRMLLFNLAGPRVALCDAAAAAFSAAEPAGLRPGLAGLAFNTAVSFTTNTNWQAYVGEIDDELLHADGGAHPPQLRLGGDRHRARRSR